MTGPLDPSPGPGTPTTSAPDAVRKVERWFVQRGVPQLIEGYSSEPAMDARAAPFIAAWLVLGSVLHWGTRPDWPAHQNAIGVVATVAWIAVAWTAAQHVRGRPFGRRPATFDGRDIVLLGALPALPAALIDRQPLEALFATLGALSGIGLIYVVIGFGLVEIGRWAIRRLWIQLANIAELVARTLPLLLILVVFLLFAAEIWEAAHAMSTVELTAVLLLLLAVATLLVVTTFRADLRALEARSDWEAIARDAAATPAASLIGYVPPGAATASRLGLLPRLNVTALVVIQQLLQGAFVAAFVMAFLVGFGLLAVPPEVQAAWTGRGVQPLATFDLLGEARTLSAELVTVSALLGGMVGLYFTGLSITDPIHRAQQFDRAVAEVRELLAARAIYAAAVRAGGTEPPTVPVPPMPQPRGVERPPGGRAAT